MTFYSTHLKPHAAPVLIPERFAWGALLLGPLWLALHRAWVALGLTVAAVAIVVAVAPTLQAVVIIAGLHLMLGLLGHDIRRWSLERGGYLETCVVLAQDEPAAQQALLHERPELADRYRPGVA